MTAASSGASRRLCVGLWRDLAGMTMSDLDLLLTIGPESSPWPLGIGKDITSGLGPLMAALAAGVKCLESWEKGRAAKRVAVPVAMPSSASVRLLAGVLRAPAMHVHLSIRAVPKVVQSHQAWRAQRCHKGDALRERQACDVVQQGSPSGRWAQQVMNLRHRNGRCQVSDSCLCGLQAQQRILW